MQSTDMCLLARIKVGLLMFKWARAVNRGDPDAACYLGAAKAAVLESLRKEKP